MNYKLILLFGLMTFFKNGNGQTIDGLARKYQIGPKGTDTSNFSKIYIFRESDKLDEYYLGFLSDDFYGLFAKVNSGNAYKIYCAPVGKHTFYFSTPVSGKKEVEIDLQPNSIHFLSLKVFGLKDYLEFTLDQLTSEQGNEVLKSFEGKINVRYSTIPYQNSFFLSDQFRNEPNIAKRMKDSVYVSISKNQHFSFLYPSQLDGGMAMFGIPTLSFLSRTISVTYSEALSFKLGGKIKVKSQEDFDRYIQKNVIDKTVQAKQSRYKNYSFEVLSKNDHPMGGYNALIYATYEDHEAANKETQGYLELHDLYRVLTWVNLKGKLELVVICLSERGCKKELSSKNEILERFNDLDKSIQLHTTK